MALITSSLKDENYSIGQLILQERSDISITGGGLIYEKMLFPPYWVGSFRTPKLDSTKVFRMLALLDNLKHNHTEFYDPRRDNLISGDAVANDSMQITSIAVNRLSMRVSGIATGTRIKTGDMISIQAGARRALVRVMQDATKQVGNLQIYITPALRPYVAVNHYVNCVKAAALFKLVPYSAQEFVDEDTKLTTLDFKLIEYTE